MSATDMPNPDIPNPEMPNLDIKVAYLLLAGGQSRRMGGGDKNLLMLGDKPVLSHILSRVGVSGEGHSALEKTDFGDVPVLLNANGDPARYAAFGLPVLADVADDALGDHAGPLAGILTGLEWAALRHPDCTHVISFATDAPFLPKNLAEKLRDALQDGGDMAQASSNGRRHPVFAIWPVSMAAALRSALINDGVRKIDHFTANYDCRIVAFDDDPDPFVNLNRPQDFTAAQNRLEIENGQNIEND